MRNNFNSDACGRDLKQYPYKQTVVAKGQPSYLFFCISYDNYLSNSEAFLLIEIFMNSQTHLIFFARERDVVRIIECYTSRFDFAVHRYLLRQ